jgi:hypothetical protein
VTDGGDDVRPEPAARGDPAIGDTAGKLIDRNSAMRMLRGSDDERDELIERYGLAGRVELEIADD